MKIVHLTYSDMGGAGIAAKQLHLALLNYGISSKLLTLISLGEKTEEHYIFQPKQSNLLKKIYNRVLATINYRLPFLSKHNKGYLLKNKEEGFEMFSFPFSNLNIQNNEHIKNADIIHLHWVSDGMIDYRFFFKNIKKPIVWTLHDMNPFTGGCHQSDGCEKYTSTCVSCFQLEGTRNERISKKNLQYKAKGLQAIKNNQLKILTPSQWLCNLSKVSKCFSRFEHFQIPNIINFPIGNITKTEARLFFNINEDERVLLFVANTTNNNRKGIDVLIKALEDIKAKEKTRLLIIGKNSPGLINDINKTELGFVTDKIILKNAYIASDVFLLPSIAENFPNTIVESLLCGTPVIASKVGGIVEQIHSENGILVPVKDVKGWTSAINSFFENQKQFNSQIISHKAFEKYNHQMILEKHLNLYTHITSQSV
jgi:glycosyltransferase involved in cell wall biosynthesis